MDLPANVANKRLTLQLNHLDATLTKNRGGTSFRPEFFLCLRPALSSYFLLESRQVHSILRRRILHERVPHKLRALVLRHQHGNPQIDADHVRVIPAGQRIERVDIPVALTGLRIMSADPSQHMNSVRKIEAQRTCRRARHDADVNTSDRRSLRRWTSPRNVAFLGIRGAYSPKIGAVIRKLSRERNAEQPVRLRCRDRILEVVREGVFLAPEIGHGNAGAPAVL